MENQTNAQNQRVPVIQVSGLKKQYKLGQIGGTGNRPPDA